MAPPPSSPPLRRHWRLELGDFRPAEAAGAGGCWRLPERLLARLFPRLLLRASEVAEEEMVSLLSAPSLAATRREMDAMRDRGGSTSTGSTACGSAWSRWRRNTWVSCGQERMNVCGREEGRTQTKRFGTRR